jgi:hypothetical protein
MMGWLRHTLILMTIAVAAVTLAVASHHSDWSVSLSGSGRHELTDASAALAGELQAPVRLVVALPPEAAARDVVRRLAQRYRHIHQAFALQFVDPADPAPEVRRLGLRPGEALVFFGDHAERVQAPTEARISAALERLLRRGERYIVWLTGHGGRDLKGEANHDLGRFGRALERKGYQLQPLSLARTPIIPDNTALLIVATPTIDFSASERAMLRDFIGRGGAVLWLADGEAATGLTDVLPVAPRPQLVLDPASEQLLGIDDPRLLLLETGAEHPVTAGLEDPLLLAGTHALTPRDGSDWTLRSLLAGADRHYLAAGPSAALEASAGKGPPPYLGITLERQSPEGPQRAAVLGDGDLLANSYLGNGGNLAFGLSLVDWLVQAEDYVGRYLTGAPDQKLRLSATGAAALAFGLLLAVPGLFAAGAIVAWRRQRHG